MKVETPSIHDVWEFDRDENLAPATLVAIDRLSPPDYRVQLLSNYGDAITVRVVSGVRVDPDALVYVERRGFYEVARDEAWGETRLLTLRAFPAK